MANPDTPTSIDRATIQAEVGYCFTVDLPGGIRGMLTENGRPLTLNDAMHDDIRRLGGGRYSFWQQKNTTLYFSTTDNTDPRTNGRQYGYWPGVELPRPEQHFLLHTTDDEFNRFYAGARARCGDGPRDRYYTLKELLRSLGRLDGDTAECGVFHGLGSAVICHYSEQLQRRPDHRHHCFDSFAGMSRPGDEDLPSRPDIRPWKAGDMAVTLDVVQRNLAEYSWVEYHRGWIPECFQSVGEARFSFVHIDVDLFKPTLDAVTFLYPRLLAGGIMLFDDYGFLTCPGARTAIDALVARTSERLIHLTTGQAFLIRRSH